MRRYSDSLASQQMNLRNRLNQIYGTPEPKSEAFHLPSSLPEFVGGRWRRRSSGTILSVESKVPVDHQHRGVPLEKIYSVEADLLCLLADNPGFKNFHPEKIFFLDTETTGLAGGAGTCIFLVGLGYFCEGQFHIHQLFLPDFESERAFLEEFDDLLCGENRDEEDVPGLVTFNGSSYDLSLFGNRFIMQRLDRRFQDFPHLDLLYPSRTLWKGRFENCALQTLERHILGFFRQEDIPSALIPRVYFDYLHSGEYRAFGKIFEHNRLDLLTLVSLLVLTAQLIQQPDSRFFVDPRSAARLHSLRGNYRQAVTLLETARQSGGHLPPEPDLLLELAFLKKRLGENDAALSLWLELIHHHPKPPREAFEEAAKILEHEKRSLQTALDLVIQGLQLYGDSASLQHRQFRLQCRLAGKRWY